MKLLPLLGRVACFAWTWRGTAGAVVFAWLAASGAFAAPGASRVVAAAALAALAAERLAARLRLRRLDLRVEAEGAALLVVAVYAALGFAGGAGGPLHPVVYACVGYLAASERLAVSGLALALAVAFESSLGGDRLPWHLGLLGLFAAGSALLFRAELWRQRREHRRRVDEAIRSLSEEARDFRLIGPALGASSRVRARAEEERMLAQGSVETIRQGLYHLLGLLKDALGLHTCVLFWLDEDRSRLKIKEMISDSDHVAEGDFPSSAGAPGAVVRTRLALSLDGPREMGLPYYRVPVRVDAFLGVPVLDGRHVRGVLCGDRSGGAPPRRFDRRDEEMMRGVAAQVVRVVETERVLGAVERSKYETERFLDASKRLASALTLDQVYDQALAAARTVAEFDFGVVTLLDREQRRHRVCRVLASDGVEVAPFEALEWGDNAGLVALAVKNKHTLEGEGERLVFSAKPRPRGMASVLVIPLVVKDEATGALVLAARRARAFSKETADRLGVIANQVAVSIENAMMYRRMEEMATTDGLTGLANHRALQERLDGMIERAARFRAPLGFLICDIDHFKSINDTWGHPVGDLVLRRVGRLLGESVRKVDVCARYGGEEFALALEQTTREGAREFAGRLRAELGRIPFTSESGAFRVRLSIGLAVFPDDARDKAALIERADKALYCAKRLGRDRVVAWADLASGSPLGAWAEADTAQVPRGIRE